MSGRGEVALGYCFAFIGSSFVAFCMTQVFFFILYLLFGRYWLATAFQISAVVGVFAGIETIIQADERPPVAIKRVGAARYLIAQMALPGHYLLGASHRIRFTTPRFYLKRFLIGATIAVALFLISLVWFGPIDILQNIRGTIFAALLFGLIAVVPEAWERGDLRYWISAEKTGQKIYALKKEETEQRRRRGHHGFLEYLGVALIAGSVLAAMWYGGWALLVRIHLLDMPVTLGYWWLVAVAWGLYQAFAQMTRDLRSNGKFPAFFAFWGPYRTAALLNGVGFGLAFTAWLISFELAQPDLTTSSIIIAGVVAAIVGAGVGVSQLANRRREYPLFAVPDVLANGAIFGLALGNVALILWSAITHTQTTKFQISVSLIVAAMLGAGANALRRFSAAPVATAFNVAIGGTSRFRVLLPGLWYLALGAGAAWLTLKFASGIMAYLGGGLAVYLFVRGLGPTLAALNWSAADRDAHGKARLATATELHRAGLTPRSPNAIYLGRLFDDGRELGEVGYAGETHLITVGRTGMGKGTGLIIPNLSTLRRSILIIDPKGEAAAITARKRAEFGRVVILNPFGLLTEQCPWLKSDGFNPLSTLRIDDRNFVDDCAVLSHALVKEETGGNARYFSGSARDLVNALIMHELISQKDNPNKATLAHIRTMLTEPYRRTETEGPLGLMKTIIEMSTSPSPALRAKAGRFINEAKSNLEVITTAINETSFIDSPPIAEDLSKGNDFQFADMKNEIVTVYLILPAKHLETHANWLRLIVASALRDLLDTPANPKMPSVLLMLDEFAQLGYLEGVSNAMNIARAYGVQLWPFVQDFTQLRDIYKDRWENFLSASAALTAFRPKELFTANYLSRLAGTKTVIVEGESERPDGSGMSRSRGPQGLPLIRPDDLMTMAPNQMFCLVDPVVRAFMARAPGYWTTDHARGLDGNPYRRG